MRGAVEVLRGRDRRPVGAGRGGRGRDAGRRASRCTGRARWRSSRRGASPADALARVLADDDQRETRQLGAVTAAGESAAHTGAECLDWAGHRTGPGYAVQGNILASEDVVVAMEAAFVDSAGMPLGHRLVAALEAGQEQGGDARGQQSAAVVVERVGAAARAARGHRPRRRPARRRPPRADPRAPAPLRDPPPLGRARARDAPPPAGLVRAGGGDPARGARRPRRGRRSSSTTSRASRRSPARRRRRRRTSSARSSSTRASAPPPRATPISTSLRE